LGHLLAVVVEVVVLFLVLLAVSDGYYLIFEPMPPGEHEIDIKSRLTNPTTGILFFADETKYHLNVAAETAESPSNSTSRQSTM
jgi:hypothetical protein